MHKPLIACAILAGLAGCAATPDGFMTTVDSNYTAPVTVPTPEVNPTYSIAVQAAIGAACADIATSRGSSIAASGINTLRLQAGFTESELAHIAAGEVASGMTERAAICALGGNSATVAEVKTITSPGHIAKVFTFTNIPGKLHTDNGLTTSFGA